MSEATGTVFMEELSKGEIFVEIESSESIRIKKKIENLKDRYNFLIENGLKDWFYGNTKKLRLDKFEIVSKLVGDIKIKEITGKQGLQVGYSNFPFNFATKEGVRFIACILGDGCIHNKGIRYHNKNEKLINNFVYLSQKIFGEISFRKYEDRKNVIRISLPNMCRRIVECVGLTAGRKSTRNVHIPKFIFNLSDDKKLEFISQFIDDEGYINDGNITIDLGFDEKQTPFLIYGLRNLIESLGIKCSIFPASEYYSLEGKKRRMWRLGIFLFRDVKKLARELILINHEKIRDCNEILNLDRIEIHKGLDDYLKVIKEIESAKGYFTVSDLANVMNRSITHSRRIVSRTRKLGLTKLISPACKGYKDIGYATYKVVK